LYRQASGLTFKRTPAQNNILSAFTVENRLYNFIDNTEELPVIRKTQVTVTMVASRFATQYINSLQSTPYAKAFGTKLHKQILNYIHRGTTSKSDKALGAAIEFLNKCNSVCLCIFGCLGGRYLGVCMCVCVCVINRKSSLLNNLWSLQLTQH